MKNFGSIKSKIELILTESYQNGKFAESFNKFRELVLSDKNVVKMFYIYDQLNDKRNVDPAIAKDFIEENIKSFENTKITKNKEESLLEWTKNVVCENYYENIDKIMDSNIINLEEKIKSKYHILETITRRSQPIFEPIQIPLTSSLSIANQTISKFLENLNENEMKEFMDVVSLKGEKLNESYHQLKTEVMAKLDKIYSENDDPETKIKIEETKNKLSSEIIDNLSYYKLKKLNESI